MVQLLWELVGVRRIFINVNFQFLLGPHLSYLALIPTASYLECNGSQESMFLCLVLELCLLDQV